MSFETIGQKTVRGQLKRETFADEHEMIREERTHNETHEERKTGNNGNADVRNRFS